MSGGLMGRVEQLLRIVNEQAEDEALWATYPFGEQPIVEAYLQQELRRLHAAVEEVVEPLAKDRLAQLEILKEVDGADLYDAEGNPVYFKSVEAVLARCPPGEPDE